MKIYKVFYRSFGNKGKVLSTILTAESWHQAERQLKALRPKASIVAIFYVQKAMIA